MGLTLAGIIIMFPKIAKILWLILVDQHTPMKMAMLTGLIYRMFEQTQFAYEMGELEKGERIVT